MEIRNLITFVHVAELNSFTKAAQALDYSQSTVSFQIKQLETELDCLLFERINHTISLTDKGRELLSYAQSVSNLTNEFMQNMKAESELKGSIHFVAPDSVCEEMLLKNYLDFHKQYPGINLRFTNADTYAMFEMLDRNEADAVFTLDSHNYQTDYIIAKEEPVEMNFVASINSPFAKSECLSIYDLVDAPFILTEKSMGYRKNFDRELAKKSIEIIPVLEVGRTDVITTLLEQTDRISYLPAFVTQKKVDEGKLIYLNVTDIRTNIWKQLIYHKNKWISNCMQVFLDYVKTHEFK